MVAKWLKRLDEVKGEEKSQQDKEMESESPAQNQEKQKVLANPSVVDLCSDEEVEKSVVRFRDMETLDVESVIPNSSLMVLDDELGEITLQDYADHINGKLDEASLRKRNRREEDSPSHNAKKQRSIKEFLTPKKSKQGQTSSFAFQRCLKTYSRRPKLENYTSGEAGGQVLRELNVKDGITSNIVMVDESQEEARESLIIDNPKPKTPTDWREPNQSDIMKEVSNSDDLIEKETSPCDPLASLDINVPSKSDPEVPSEIYGEANKNINILNESPKNMPLLKDILSTDPEAHKENNPDMSITPEVPTQSPINAIRIRSDLVPYAENMIRVRTDLLQEQVDPSEPFKALGTAEKLRLLPPGKQCNSLQPKTTDMDDYNPTSVTTSTNSPNFPDADAPGITYTYQINRLPSPPAPATTSSNPATAPYNASPVSTQPSGLLPAPVFHDENPRPLSVVTTSVINSRYPVDPRPANSYWYTQPNHHPATSVVPTPTSTTSIYQPTTSSSYQGQNPVPAVLSSGYIPGPPDSRAANNNAPIGSNPRTDLTNIMRMLADVSFFAYCQNNREAYHLVNQLRHSLQTGASNRFQAPSEMFDH